MLWEHQYKVAYPVSIEDMQAYLKQIERSQAYEKSCTAWCLAQLFSSIIKPSSEVATRNLALESYIQSKIHSGTDFNSPADPLKLLSFIIQTMGANSYRLVNTCPQAFEILTQKLGHELIEVLAQQEITEYDSVSLKPQIFLRFSGQEISSMHTQLGINTDDGILLIDPSDAVKKEYKSMSELENDEAQGSWLSIFIDPRKIKLENLFLLEEEATKWYCDPQNLSFVTAGFLINISLAFPAHAEALITRVLSSDAAEFQRLILPRELIEQTEEAHNILANPVLQNIRAFILNGSITIEDASSIIQVLGMGTDARRQRLITPEQAAAMPSACHLQYLLTDNGVQMLMEGRITPEQAAAMPYAFYLQKLLTDNGVRMLMEGRITPEQAAAMSYDELQSAIESFAHEEQTACRL